MGLDRPDRTAERLGDRRLRKILVIAQHDGGALRPRQRPEYVAEVIESEPPESEFASTGGGGPEEPCHTVKWRRNEDDLPEPSWSVPESTWRPVARAPVL